MKTCSYSAYSARGGAALEFLLCLPLLTMLAFPVIDFARLLQADVVLTNMAREGANLASRTGGDEQAIMQSLAATALPLDMARNGMIHITKILALRKNGVVRNVAIAQHRWAGGQYAPTQGIWNCGDDGSYWDRNGKCAGMAPPSAAPIANVMSGLLNDGDVISVVEVFYRFPLLLDVALEGAIAGPGIEPKLYAMTIF